ncbi:MAG: hypothetical protein WEB00_09445 [Dehalococcoidia bacterium]
MIAISAGSLHSMALLADGSVMAWGSDVAGQLGNGPDFDSKAVPVPVRDIVSATAISAGGGHSLALLEDFTVRSWGSDSFGQLGNGGVTGDQPVPVQVLNNTGEGFAPLTSVRAVSAGGEHSLAIITGGITKSWGSDGRGQLGDGSGSTNRPAAFTINNFPGAVAIDAGAFFSMAIVFDGAVKSWGEDTFGELGNGNGSSGQFSVSPSPVSVSGVLGSGGAAVVAAGGNHTVVIRAMCNGQLANITGNNLSNTLTGGTGNDVIQGLGGPDRIRAGGGNDTICGGDGDDLIQGGTGDNQVFGDGGVDTAEYPEGAVEANLLPGQRKSVQGADEDSLTSIENLEGSPQGDTLIGGVGGNRIDGNGGDDEIGGVFSNDTLNGGAGNDNIDGGPHDDVINGNTGEDDIDGDTGTDTVSYAGEVEELIIDLQLDRATLLTSPTTTEDLFAVENITGGNSSDLIAGDAAPNTLRGGAGPDVIVGRGDVDQLFGDLGDDDLSGGSSVDGLDGGEGSDTAFFGEESVIVRIAERVAVMASGDEDLVSIENATGSPFSDILHGDDGPNVLDGGGAGDIVEGLGGDDTLLGGPGDDAIVPGDGTAIIDGGDDRDLLIYENISGPVNANLNLQRTLGSDGNDTLEGIEDLIGTEFNDTLVGDDNDNRLSGAAGLDIIIGNGGADGLFGGTENDFLSGGPGEDELDGGTEDDQLSGGDDPDILDGGPGVDEAIFTSSPVVVNLATGR